MAGPD